MNRLTLSVLLLVGCACGQPAGSDPLEVQLARQDESELLLGYERLFADFCRESLQFVLADLGQSAPAAPAGLTGQFLSAAGGIPEALLEVEREAAGQLAGRFAASQTAGWPAGAPMPESEIAALIEEGKREIKRIAATGATGDRSALKGASSALLSVANSALFVKLAQARSQMGADALRAQIGASCATIKGYQEVLEQNLVAYKDKLASEHDDKNVLKFLGSVGMLNIRCQTTRNVVRLSAFCDLFKAENGPFARMLALGPANQH